MSLLKKSSKTSSAMARRNSVGSLMRWQEPSLEGTEGSVAALVELSGVEAVVSFVVASA